MVSVLVLELARVLQEKALAVSVPASFLVVGLVFGFLQGRVASRLPVSSPVLMVVGLLWEARVPALGVSFPASFPVVGLVFGFLQEQVASRLRVSSPVLALVANSPLEVVLAFEVSFPASWEMEGVVDCLEEVSETAFDFVWVSETLVEKTSEWASDSLTETPSELAFGTPDSLVETLDCASSHPPPSPLHPEEQNDSGVAKQVSGFERAWEWEFALPAETPSASFFPHASSEDSTQKQKKK